VSNCLIRFITDAMEPSRYVDDPARFDALCDSLTEALALVGLKINDRGQVARAAVASTLDDVAKLAGRLQTELRRRGVHDQVLTYCRAELIRRSLFHAVFEATKGLAATAAPPRLRPGGKAHPGRRPGIRLPARVPATGNRLAHDYNPPGSRCWQAWFADWTCGDGCLRPGPAKPSWPPGRPIPPPV